MKHKLLAVLFLLMLPIIAIAQTEEEWFPYEGIQPYSLEEQELNLQKGDRRSSPLIVKFPNGLIVDWEKGIIAVRGQEFITGKQTLQNKQLIIDGAVYNAKMRMVKLIDEFRIDRSRRLADLFTDSYKLKTKIERLITGYSNIIHKKYSKDTKVLEVTLALNIYGKNSLAESLYWSLFYWEDGWNKYYPTFKTLTGEAYTGLIVDARDLDVEPAFLPRIVDESENNLYRDKYVKYDILVNKGLVSYNGDIDDAIANRTVGPNPLVIKAVTKVNSAYGSDLIISDEDKETLKNADKKATFLKYLRVLIVL